MLEDRSNQRCQTCLRKDAEIINLKRITKELLTRNEHALSITGFALRELKNLQIKTQRVLSKKSGVPRGGWSYIKGLDSLIYRAIEFLNLIAEALRY